MYLISINPLPIDIQFNSLLALKHIILLYECDIVDIYIVQGYVD